MNNDIEYKMVGSSQISGVEAYNTLTTFLEENSDLDAINKIQSTELLSFLRKQSNITDFDRNEDCIEDGMKDLE